MNEQSLQDRYAPANKCFGCGPSNEKGLRIKSFVEGDEVVAVWNGAEEHHQAFEHMLNGGICGALLDCHSNWTAALHLMGQSGRDAPPCTVTAEFHVRLLRVTPSGGPLRLRSRVVESLAAWMMWVKFPSGRAKARSSGTRVSLPLASSLADRLAARREHAVRTREHRRPRQEFSLRGRPPSVPR